MMQIINLHHGKPDYIEFVNRNTLSVTEEIDKDTHVIMAVYVGKTRLIDNMQLIGR
jgi:pantothenate synthetase